MRGGGNREERGGGEWQERGSSRRGSKAGSDRKVVVDSLGRHPTRLWDESRLCGQQGSRGAFGVNFYVGTPSRCGPESRQFSQKLC